MKVHAVAKVRLDADGRVTGLQLSLTFTVTPWLLYPGGVAAACPHRDPLTLDLDPVALDKLDDCEGGRWRRGAKGIELQDDDDDEWTSSMVWEQQPLAAGAALDFDGTVQGGGDGCGVQQVGGHGRHALLRLRIAAEAQDGPSVADQLGGDGLALNAGGADDQGGVRAGGSHHPRLGRSPQRAPRSPAAGMQEALTVGL